MITFAPQAAHANMQAAVPVAGVGDHIFVVNTHAAGVVHKPDGSTFYPTGQLPPGTLLVIPDESGALPGDMSLSEIKASAASAQANGGHAMARSTSSGPNTTSVAPMSALCPDVSYSALYNTWSAPNSWSCGYIGTNWTVQAPYWFVVGVGTNQYAAGQGLGFYQGYNGTTFGVWSAWYFLGTADGNTPGGLSVPWGYVAATPQFKAESLNIPLAMGSFGL